MKISGVTIIRNAVINDYPVFEAISSIIPMVDEMIVLVGDCADETEALIRSIGSEKIKIFHSVWDMSIIEGGKVLAIETDKAMKHVSADSDWVFYLQADELVHEKYHNTILEAAKQYLHHPQVEGLLFKYLHFYGTYDYVGDSRKWYDREIRLIRNDRSIKAYRDAQGFRKNGQKLQVKLIDAYIYHYGWVKNPEKMKEKIKNFSSLYGEAQEAALKAAMFDYNSYDSVAFFQGSHPKPMQERVARKNWQLNLDTKRKNMKPVKRLLYFFKKRFGWRLFEYKNYHIIK